MMKPRENNSYSISFPLKNITNLRKEIKRLERLNFKKSNIKYPLRTGITEIDSFLPAGGLPRGSLHEFSGKNVSVTGFITMLLAHIVPAENGVVLWCRNGSELYAPGLAYLGLEPEKILLVRGDNRKKLLWAMEEGLGSGVPIVVIGEIKNIPSFAIRRLQLAAEAGGVTGFLIRAEKNIISSLVATCWHITTRPSSGKLPNLAWKIQLLRARGGTPREWKLEQENDQEQWYTTRCLPLVP